MPIYLEPPTYQAGGPDGRGWNRLSLNAHMGNPTARCALRPRDCTALYEILRDSRLCQWNTRYAACDRTPAGDCSDCPRVAGLKRPRLLPVSRSVTSVVVRVYESEKVCDLTPGGIPAKLRICVRKDGTDGDDDAWRCASVWTWEEMAGLAAYGWRVGRGFRDERGPGFWLHRALTEDGAA